MPLHLGGGAYVPAFRWKSNQISFVITVQGNDGVAEQPIQVQQVLLDFWNIRTGWCCLGKGQAPQWVMDPNLNSAAPNPNPQLEFKRAFLVNAFNSQIFQGESVRQWGETGIGAGMGVQAAYAQFEAQMAQHQRGEVPIIQMTGFTNHGQFNVPNLSVVGWTARPADLMDKAPEPGMSADPTASNGAAGQSPAPSPAQGPAPNYQQQAPGAAPAQQPGQPAQQQQAPQGSPPAGQLF